MAKKITFEKAFTTLRDCVLSNYMESKLFDKEEMRYRQQLINLCKEVGKQYGSEEKFSEFNS